MVMSGLGFPLNESHTSVSLLIPCDFHNEAVIDLTKTSNLPAPPQISSNFQSATVCAL